MTTTHQVFAALGDPTRLEVLNRLARSGPATATELAAGLPVTRQAVAKHLAALDAVGLVERERSGREVRYRFSPRPLGEAAEWMETIGDQWEARLARLRQRLE